MPASSRAQTEEKRRYEAALAEANAKRLKAALRRAEDELHAAKIEEETWDRVANYWWCIRHG